MVRLRLKSDCKYLQVTIPQGTVTRVWQEFPPNSFITKEMEVFGQEQPKPIEVPETAEVVKEMEPEPIQPVLEAKEEPKVEVEEKPRRRGRKRRF